MSYTVKQVDGKYRVAEDDSFGMVLGNCDTQEAAEQVIKEWEARDELREAIDIFSAAMVLKYSPMLDIEEIQKMIQYH